MTTAAGGGNGLDPLHCAGGCGSCIGSGVEDCSWGVWLLKGIGVMLECCMCVFSVCMCVCGY